MNEEDGRSKGLLEQPPRMWDAECRQAKGGRFEDDVANIVFQIPVNALGVAPLER